MSKPILHTKIWWFVSELTIFTKMCNVWTWKNEVMCPNVCYTRKYVMSEPDMSYHMLNAKIWCLVCKKMHNIQTNLCYTLKYYVVSPKWCYIRQCYMLEHMLHTKIWCFVSALKLHTRYVMSEHVSHEYEMSDLMLHMEIKYVRTYFTHKNMMCPNWCYIRKFVISEHMFHKKKYDVSCPNLRCIKMCNIETCVPNEYGIWSVRINVTYEICVMSGHI